MMEVFYKPTAETLEQLKNEALDGGRVKEEDWQQKLCNSIAGNIKRDPRSYRAYGPFWWVLKRAMIDNGVTDFGTTIDAQWFENADYGNTTDNMLAAWLYGDNAMDNGLIYSNAHNVTFAVSDDEKGDYHDTREYVLVDDEVETLALG